MSPWWWQIPALLFASALGIVFMFWSVLGSFILAEWIFRPRTAKDELDRLREKGL